MTANFTKGDWMVSGDDQIVSMPSQCKIANRISGWNYEELKANARLIAAAPKMFYTLDLIANMEEDRGRSGCTYGDTEYDSESAVYGYNQCLENIKNIVNKALKKAIDSSEIKTERHENNN